ncbi:RagB/SusD family nutrient uptake outer membrane protein [Chitinophaga eiseniae]|uniref:RagB/SusD family nutrient uptake outer membrane protein n=1 Tax=Chitinophaga eiseniae TaxID=634771 RepID=A0A847SW39_9BACT|nr:RagB/SusD family nutrient uptake outer membrane protein [Chitinophaga eiseniae]NLR81182.1 RagB/SusD family nutrient uptake outer membrane protein [Chitinophaga eiseniae]
MKVTFKNTIRIAMLPILLQCACNKDFLDIRPKGKLIASSINDYDLLLNNVSLLTRNNEVTVPMGDEILAVDNMFTGTTLRAQRLFRWEDVIYNDNEQAPEMDFSDIYIYNKIINEAGSAADGTVQQQQSLIAEAKAMRAWSYFQLINFYGKPYQKATAANDPGLPIVTTSDVTQHNFTRANVQDVYNFIIKDLSDAIPLLPVKITSRIRMGQAAAQALLGKVYLFMGNPEAALPLLDAAVNNISLTSAGTNASNMALYDLNVTMADGGPWGYNMAFPPFSFGIPSISNNTESLFARQFINYWTFSSAEFALTPETVQRYSSSDQRLKFLSAFSSPGTPYPVAGSRRKFGMIACYNGITLPDLYLLRAECRARLNDLPGAESDVEMLRTKRMSAAEASLPPGMGQAAMIQFVIEERIREFALQGQRWFDMRRLSTDPLFSQATYRHYYYDATGKVVASYILKPERLTLRLPQVVINQNPGMINNP